MANKDENVESLITDVVSKSKNSKTVDPSVSAKEALKSISNISAYTVDVNDMVDKVLKNAEYGMSKTLSWPDAVSYFEKNEKGTNDTNNSFVDALVTENVSANLNSRKLRYREYRSSIKKLPILNKILRVYTSNILSPDDMTKISIRMMPNDSALKDDEDIKSIVGKFNIILNKINLEKYVADAVYKTFFLGDYFIEIQSSKRSLVQTLYNLQLPIIESKNFSLRSIYNNNISDNSKTSTFHITENGTDKVKIKYTPDKTCKRNVSLKIEESYPIINQITDTTESLHKMINEIFSLPSDAILTESIIENKIKDDFILENTLKILCSKFLNEDMVLNIKSDYSKKDSDDNYISKNSASPSDLKHIMDVLPTEASLSNLTLKSIDPDKIVVLEKDGVCYGYLHVNGAYDTPTGFINNGGMSSTSTSLNSNKHELEKTYNDSVVNNFIKTLSDYFKGKFGEVNSDGTSKFNIEDMAPGLQQLVSDILNSDVNNQCDIMVRYIPPSNIQHFKRKGTDIYYPYGESLLDDLMFVSRMVLADNISSTINKISRIGKRLTFNVKGNTFQQALSNIMDVKAAISKQVVTMDKLGSMDTIPSDIYSLKNVYVPVVNGERQIEIDSVDMGTFADHNDPHNNMIKQLITGADVPPTHLGYDEFTNSKANLTSENVVFAQNVIAAQKEYAEQFTELMQKIYIALYLKTKDFDTNYKFVKFTFNAPRSIMLNIFSENLNYLSTIIDALEKLEIPKDKIIERYFPELISIDYKINDTISKLSKKGKDSENPFDMSGGGSDSGLAPFESPSDSSGGDFDFSNLDLGGQNTPPQVNQQPK